MLNHQIIQRIFFQDIHFKVNYFVSQDDIMESIILAIKDDDIYKQMPAYPQAKYRSFALANQSSMLFVLLYFMPNVLNRAMGTMR
jgi:hypothetical protein